MLKKVSFSFNGKKASVLAKKCVGINRSVGLMFKRREKARALLFEFKRPTNLRISSLFVFFPFIVVWLDRKNRVLEIRKVKPFIISVMARKPYKKFLEIPLNSKYEKQAEIFFSRR